MCDDKNAGCVCVWQSSIWNGFGHVPAIPWPIHLLLHMETSSFIWYGTAVSRIKLFLDVLGGCICSATTLCFFGLAYFATNQVDLEHCSVLQCCTATQAEAETLNHQDGDGSECCVHDKTVEISTYFNNILTDQPWILLGSSEKSMLQDVTRIHQKWRDPNVTLTWSEWHPWPLPRKALGDRSIT